MFHGHDPREIEEYPWRAIDLFLSVEQDLSARHSLGDVGERG